MGLNQPNPPFFVGSQLGSPNGFLEAWSSWKSIFKIIFFLHHFEKWPDSQLHEAVGIHSRPSVSAVSSH